MKKSNFYKIIGGLMMAAALCGCNKGTDDLPPAEPGAMAADQDGLAVSESGTMLENGASSENEDSTSEDDVSVFDQVEPKENPEKDPDVLYEQVMNGDFSSLLDTHERIEHYEQWYQECTEPDSRYGLDLRRMDLDNDGLDEIVWQIEGDVISYIFSVKDGLRCIYLDEVDSSNYCFISDAGKLIWTCSGQSAYQMFRYIECNLTESGDIAWTRGITLWNITSLDMENWEEDHPDMMEIRIYYVYTDYENRDPATGRPTEYEITEAEFKVLYEEMLGQSYEEFKEDRLW